MNFRKIDFKNPQQLSSQIIAILEQKIVNKEIKIGEKLPTQEELSRIFNVSINTAKEALSNLARDGYVVRRRKHGTVVVNSRVKKGLDLARKNEIAIVNCAVDINNPADDARYRQIIRGIEERAKEKGIYLLTITVKNNEDIPFLTEKQKDIAGLIVVDSITMQNYRLIKSMKIPFVLIGDLYDKVLTEPEVNMIVNNDFQSTYLATKHLVGLGHRRIGYLSPFLNKYSWHIEKMKGYETALKESGVSYDRNLVIETGNTDNLSVGIAKTRELLQKSVVFTALVCNEPELCVGTKKALEEAGMKVPEDVSIVGIPGTPDFTSISYDSKEMGRVAVEKLIECQTNPDWKPGRVLVPHKMFDRGSTERIKSAINNQQTVKQ
jgi:DNA-binding LacI/PurR family transcriptional regulator